MHSIDSQNSDCPSAAYDAACTIFVKTIMTVQFIMYTFGSHSGQISSVNFT